MSNLSLRKRKADLRLVKAAEIEKCKKSSLPRRKNHNNNVVVTRERYTMNGSLLQQAEDREPSTRDQQLSSDFERRCSITVSTNTGDGKRDSNIHNNGKLNSPTSVLRVSGGGGTTTKESSSSQQRGGSSRFRRRRGGAAGSSSERQRRSSTGSSSKQRRSEQKELRFHPYDEVIYLDTVEYEYSLYDREVEEEKKSRDILDDVEDAVGDVTYFFRCLKDGIQEEAKKKLMGKKKRKTRVNHRGKVVECSD